MPLNLQYLFLIGYSCCFSLNATFLLFYQHVDIFKYKHSCYEYVTFWAMDNTYFTLGWVCIAFLLD